MISRKSHKVIQVFALKHFFTNGREQFTFEEAIIFSFFEVDNPVALIRKDVPILVAANLSLGVCLREAIPKGMF